MRRHHLVVGREDELARLRQLFEPGGPTCVVIEGEAGIGKTTLWRAGVEEARERWDVLAARPAEGEASLPFSALGDLLEPLLDAEADDLTMAEREALEPALQPARSAEPASRLAVSRAVIALLRRAAARNPLLIAVDDVQWLDPPTAEVLEFAFRRLSESPVCMLVARRSDGEAPLPLGLDRVQLPAAVAHLRMGLHARRGRQRPARPAPTAPLPAATLRAPRRHRRQSLLRPRDRPSAAGRRPPRRRCASTCAGPRVAASTQARGALGAGPPVDVACFRVRPPDGDARRTSCGRRGRDRGGGARGGARRRRRPAAFRAPAAGRRSLRRRSPVGAPRRTHAPRAGGRGQARARAPPGSLRRGRR